MKKPYSFFIAIALAGIVGQQWQLMAADITVDNEIRRMTQIDEATAVTVSGKGELHLTARQNPLPAGSSVELVGSDAMICFEGLLPSEAKAEDVFSRLTINGEPFDESKHRLLLYGSGCAVMSDGFSNPLTIYDAPDFKGNSKVCVADIYYRSDNRIGQLKWLTDEGLGDFDNNIRSFRLRRGWQATFANNYNGTGYSRVFVADDADIEVPVMPDGLEFVSFIRVCRHDPVGKKGVCSKDHVTLARSTWYYDWGGGSVNLEDGQYVPMRHNQWWDSWDNINTRVGATCLLGCNEPDHADQSDLSVDKVIEMWPYLMRSGLRVGSPAPDQIGKDWLRRFIATADSLNYRVDFVATHMYWENQTPEGLTKNIENCCRNYYGGRQMWITEWNNGANWTHEYWPDANGTKLDANFQPVLDEHGNEQYVARPHTQANSEKQCLWLESMLKAFDECPYLERHSLYSWVEDARSITLPNTAGKEELTPAGRIFADFQSRPAYNKDYAYVHEWRIAPPFPVLTLSKERPVLRFVDNNGETGVNYIIERRLGLSGAWQQVAVLLPGKDYAYGSNAKFTDKPERSGKYYYRVKATSYKGTESIYSRELGVKVSLAGIDGVGADCQATLTVTDDGTLVLENYPVGSYSIFGLDGRVVRSVEVAGGRTTVGNLPRGFYIFSDGRRFVI